VKEPGNTPGSVYEDAQILAEDAYIFGYPLVVMDVARRIHTAVPFPTPQAAPTNQFAHTRVVAGAHDKDIVRPNADSLDSVAWLDVSKEPVILRIPLIDRYFLFPIWSAWYDLLEVISPRTVGRGDRHIAIVGPEWHGKLPARVDRVTAPTETVWINGRFQAAGVEDIESVHRLQNQVLLVPLSEWGKTMTPRTHLFLVNLDVKTNPQEQVARMDASTFYTRLSQLLLHTNPRSADAPMVEQLRRIGVYGNANFALRNLRDETVQAMRAAVPSAQLKIASAERQAVPRLPSKWAVHVHPGRYETNYLYRAVGVKLGLAAAPVEEVFRLHTNMDETGDPLRGSHRYTITFEHLQHPPVHAFWSITLYNSKQLLAANAIQRHVIGDLNKLKLNADGSLTIYIQHEWPGMEKDLNWLPAPYDAFELVFQLYWPKPQVLQGRWRPPGVKRVH
jgi:hypothetical protein